jgi:Mn-containing catalase
LIFIPDFHLRVNSAQLCCSCRIAAEQKARTTYDNILRFADDPDVRDPIKFLRAREVVHYQRFGEAKRTKGQMPAVRKNPTYSNLA